MSKYFLMMFGHIKEQIAEGLIRFLYRAEILLTDFVLTPMYGKLPALMFYGVMQNGMKA